jgi:hypothetical protein
MARERSVPESALEAIPGDFAATLVPLAAQQVFAPDWGFRAIGPQSKATSHRPLPRVQVPGCHDDIRMTEAIPQTVEWLAGVNRE